MVFYSLVVIFFALWLACRWVARHGGSEHPRGWRFWRNLSDASFGVYLIHALILNALLRTLVPAMPVSWFEPLRVFLTWFLTAGGALVLSLVLVRIPVLSRLVGRPTKRKQRTRAVSEIQPTTEPGSVARVLDQATPDATAMPSSL
jgi:surface polysaccharide O-acyltransferase-like enzyme